MSSKSEIKLIESKIRKYWRELDEHYCSFSSNTFTCPNEEEATKSYIKMKHLKNELDEFSLNYTNNILNMTSWTNLYPTISNYITQFETILSNFENCDDYGNEFFG